MRPRVLAVVGSATAAVLGLLGPATSAHAAVQVPGAPGAGLTSARSLQLALLAQSDSPKRITFDALTGAVTGVQLLAGAAAPQTVTVHNPCQSGDACWVPDAVPYADFGFAGTGTKTGSWVHRRQMYTYNHSTKICWTYQGNNACSPQVGKNSVLDPLATVTGTKVINYS